MNKLMRKLSISILAVVFAVIAMGATTFAWFTLTNTAKVSQFEIDVTSAEGIELSVVDGVWATTISGSVIEGLTGVSGAKLTAVTTPDGEATFKTLDTLSQTGAYTLKGADAGSHFAQFTIKVRTRTASTPIYIDHLNTSIASSGISWQPDTSFTRSDGATITEETSPFIVYASHSARMSFDGDSTVIYEDTSAGTSGQSSDWTKGALNYFAAKNNYTGMGVITPAISAYTSKPVGVAEGTVIATTANALDDDGWSETTIDVRIWLEGWDAECYNAIFSDTLQITIGFTTVDPTAPID